MRTIVKGTLQLLKTTRLLIFCTLLATAAAAQTTNYTIPNAGCVYISNCIIYGPGEAWGLWESTGYSIFNVYSWVNGFSVVDTYSCSSNSSYTTVPNSANGPTGVTVLASCSGVDADGVTFTLSYTINAYSYKSRGGGGKGGGGAGTRYAVTGGTITLIQP